MTIASLAVPYVDSRPSDLAFALGLVAQPALLTKELVFGEARIELRLLGMSHQVLITGSGRLSETVACVEGGTEVPSHFANDGYDFESSITRLDHNDFDAQVSLLLDQLNSNDTALAASFPGSHQAVTGLEVTAMNEDGATWQTWHAYPQEFSIVHTRSSYRWNQQ